MSGVTKHIFEHELDDILSMWNTEIKSVTPLLPRKYTKADIIALLKYYYPHEWQSVESKYKYYRTKDKYLKRRFGKSRYNMSEPELLIQRVSAFKKIFSESYKYAHWNAYSERNRVDSSVKLWEARKYKIDRINSKIELKDTELNKQLREEAFFHLQSFNFNPRLRKQRFMRIHAKTKKRKCYLREVYPNERYDIPRNPDELEYRIENSKEQKLKSYDYFISHSSKDSKEVQKLIYVENQQGKNVFCDWINDIDYLKRHLLCDATLKVLEERMKQSKALIFVQSENSLKSIWCKYELNYFLALNRPIYVVDRESIVNNLFSLSQLDDNWFVDPNYKKTALITGEEIN